MMTGRERLMATLRGEAVDRPAVNLYEIGGFDVDPADPSEFNVYNDPSWRPLLQLAERRTDVIRMRSAVRGRSWDPQTSLPKHDPSGCLSEFVRIQRYVEEPWHCMRVTVRVGGRTLSCTTRRNPAVDTVWTTEHLLKNTEDLRAYLQLPEAFFAEEIDMSRLVQAAARTGDRGIVMVDTEDPLCAAAGLFRLEDFLTIALTEQTLFHQLLEKLSRPIHARTRGIAAMFPGHLWRIYGPEYAAEPFLPPPLFREYVVRYTEPMVRMIKKRGGFARIHCHGRIANILDSIVAMGADAIDPIEPPPQGDVELAQVRERYGKHLVLFGNLEVSDIETMEPEQFKRVVEKALADGTRGQGRGFVLMPSSAPNGRQITARTLQNYETMVDLAETFRC